MRAISTSRLRFVFCVARFASAVARSMSRSVFCTAVSALILAICRSCCPRRSASPTLPRSCASATSMRAWFVAPSCAFWDKDWNSLWMLRKMRRLNSSRSVKISSIVMLETSTRVSPSMMPFTMFSRYCVSLFFSDESAKSMAYFMRASPRSSTPT
ncbi:hypothetical protein ONZ43_g7727 [Nemania bipapillata]|uniref:Uncharacterized protein n=1 Tax=Nemania bipapillata TaxID=110536 RepID=A0ACC2HP10_9PEZI|nr:hypothetical protein ONZ43_g7727 [Nemania bipapillata]